MTNKINVHSDVHPNIDNFFSIMLSLNSVASSYIFEKLPQ